LSTGWSGQHRADAEPGQPSRDPDAQRHADDMRKLAGTPNRAPDVVIRITFGPA
jgi:hypothetical protein